MPYTPILATLGYVLSPEGGRVLLIHRNARPDDPAYGKYNGLGGKVEADEDEVIEAVEAESVTPLAETAEAADAHGEAKDGRKRARKSTAKKTGAKKGAAAKGAGRHAAGKSDDAAHKA